MNQKEVAFIICADHEQYYNECVRYINELEIPESYSIDIICIQEADSMIQGYHAGMQASDAKYKVYLHQDIFILNKNFINDILKIFQQDESIGLIGMIGCSSLPEDADCMQCWDVGDMEVFDGRTLADNFKLQQPDHEYEEAAAIQGTIMVTQYDVGWREELLELLDGWEFYDIALSLEMIKNGYKIVVPKQTTSWCYHANAWEDHKEYDKYRLKMIKEYPDFFICKENDKEEIFQKIEQTEQIIHIRNEMIRLMEKGMFQTMEELAEEIHLSWPLDIQMREIANMMEIYMLEESSNMTECHSEWFGMHNWEQMYECYNWVRLVLIRIANQRKDERIEELRKKILSGRISYDAVYLIARISLKNMKQADQYCIRRMIEEPLVSVIVPVYNGQDTIGQTIESVLNQTYRNIELIIIDDASTDQSRDIIARYQDERIKVIDLEKNQNVCNAGNIGFQNAKGKYAALIGHDDLWREDKLYKQVSFLEDHSDYSVCFTWVDIIDENNQIRNVEYYPLYQKLLASNFHQSVWIDKMLKKSNHMCAPSACIRREILEKTGYYRYGLLQYQDYELWLRLLTEGPVYILQEKLTYYRQFYQDKNKKNLSVYSPGKWNRLWHEYQWIVDHFIRKMDDEKFAGLFRKFMKNPDAQGKKEILCEKAFILWNLDCCFAVKLFMDLLEDEESRNILRTKYQVELNDFYQMNKKALPFDPGNKDTAE